MMKKILLIIFIIISGFFVITFTTHEARAEFDIDRFGPDVTDWCFYCSGLHTGPEIEDVYCGRGLNGRPVRSDLYAITQRNHGGYCTVGDAQGTLDAYPQIKCVSLQHDQYYSENGAAFTANRYNLNSCISCNNVVVNKMPDGSVEVLVSGTNNATTTTKIACANVGINDPFGENCARINIASSQPTYRIAVYQGTTLVKNITSGISVSCNDPGPWGIFAHNPTEKNLTCIGRYVFTDLDPSLAYSIKAYAKNSGTSYISSASCEYTVSPMPLVCQNLYASSLTPQLGDSITLTCEKNATYTNAVTYDFMLIKKDEQSAADPNPTPTPFVNKSSNTITTYTFPVDQYGYYLFMCRVCSGAMDDTCTAWQRPGVAAATPTPTPTSGGGGADMCLGECVPDADCPLASRVPGGTCFDGHMVCCQHIGPTTPTATPIPAVVISLNESSGTSCDAVCSAQGRSCASVGTDANATDGLKWSTRCNHQSSTCAEGMAPGTRDCSGHTGMWTNCRCI